MAVREAAGGTLPAAAWDAAAAALFADSPTGAKKNCPRSAFLSLAGAREIAGIPAGRYTDSSENRLYAETALALIREGNAMALSTAALWNRVMDGTVKRHNSQMDVAIALWRDGRFRDASE